MSMLIKLMADYSASPLWDCATGRNLPLDKIEVSPGLREDLSDWARRFDATLNPADPISSGFQTTAELLSFEDEGIRLWRRLVAEIGGGAVVRYFSSVERRLIDGGGSSLEE
jgi:hypothetical protein